MFHDVDKKILEQMKRLEAIDSQDRVDGTSRMQRLRQIPPETGQFLALLAANSPKGQFIEIGTSAGYSSLHLSLVCKERNIKLDTFELLPEKIKLAKETFELAGVNNIVNLIEGDALNHLQKYNDIALCFLDAEKEVYQECYNLVIPKLVKGGIFTADNVISHKEELQQFVDHALEDTRVDALVVPIGKGVLVCRKN